MNGFSVRYESAVIPGSRLRVGWRSTFEAAESLARLALTHVDTHGCPVFIIDESDGFEVEIRGDSPSFSTSVPA